MCPNAETCVGGVCQEEEPPACEPVCLPSGPFTPCGDDGCGGSCGTCGDGFVCMAGDCHELPPTPESGSAFISVQLGVSVLPLASVNLVGMFCDGAVPSPEYPHYVGCLDNDGWDVKEYFTGFPLETFATIQLPQFNSGLPTKLIAQVEGEFNNGQPYYMCNSPDGPSSGNGTITVYNHWEGGSNGSVLPVTFHPGADGGCLMFVDLMDVYIYP